MHRIIIALAYTIVSMDMVQSAANLYVILRCQDFSWLVDCSDVQSWVIDLAKIGYAIKFFLGILALIGFGFIIGNLIVPWICSEMVLLTPKVVKTMYYAHFYPISTIRDEYNPATFPTVYMQTLLEFTVHLIAWILICHAHDDLHNKLHLKRTRRREKPTHETTIHFGVRPKRDYTRSDAY